MANEGLWELLENLDCLQTTRSTLCEYKQETSQYILKLLNVDFTIDLKERKIFSNSNNSSIIQAKYLEELCILSYLTHARELPLADKLVKAESLPGGQFFFRGLHKLPTKKLENTFGDTPETIYKVSEKLDAQKYEYGDASVSLFTFPRIPLTIIIWKRCEEFDARASILFDQTASSHLPLDALLVAVNLTVEYLIK